MDRSVDPSGERSGERWRVEELARRADVSVDTIRFYQKRRLLPPPARAGRVAWYGPEHLTRLARIRELRADGLTLALIGRLLAGDLDATDVPLAAEVASTDHDEELLTLAELAARAQVPDALLDVLAREGLLVPRAHDGGARFTPADVAVVREGARLLEHGLPLAELLALAREHHAAVRATADRAVDLFDTYVRAPLRAADGPDLEKAQALVDAFRVLFPAVSSVVAHHFRRVLLAVAQEHLERVGEDAEIAAASAEAMRDVERGWLEGDRARRSEPR